MAGFGKQFIGFTECWVGYGSDTTVVFTYTGIRTTPPPTGRK